MILQALSRYYQRLIERPVESVAPFGYSPEKISFEILLAFDGSVVRVNDLRDTPGKAPRPRLLYVPQPEKRTIGIKSNFLWDKTSYVLGVSNTSKRADKEHAAFCGLHEAALAGLKDPGLKALLAFLRGWSPAQFESHRFPPEMIDANLVFRLDGEQIFLHDRPAAQGVRAKLRPSATGQTAITGQTVCLVSGETLRVARLHPPIKGVSGAQSSGASIVSFNLEASTSYGKSQGDNAPVSEQAAFAYSTALNYLLQRGEHNRQRSRVGDTTVVFWAEAPDAKQAREAEDLFAAFFGRPADDTSETARARDVMDHVAKGHPLGDVAPNLDPAAIRMYVLGLVPNASRLSVRFWQVDTLEMFARRIAEHTQDLRLEPLPWRTEPSAYRLVLATVPHREGANPKIDDAIHNVIGAMMRAILGGGLYPRSLLANIIMRFRADGDITGLRVALCKGVLAREQRRGLRPSEEELPVSLDRQSTQPGYLLGRLFAVLEIAQRAASGIQANATIRARYYGAASAAPASIFPLLLRNTQNHLARLRSERRGQAVNLAKDIHEIVAGLPEQFPRSLKIEDQGRFAIGYYHQSQSYFTRRNPAAVTDVHALAEPTDIETEGSDQ